ncbi:Uncharacterised protein [Collinsella intestinalis]|nr:Uncharacterised protein [Collinsella intestinalis]
MPLVEADRARGQARRVGGGAGDVDLGGLGNDPRRQVGELAGMQVDHAARYHHDRLAREPKRMAHGLARLGLRLARDCAGVDDDDVGLVLINQRKAGAHEVGGDAVGFDAVDPATQVDHAGEGTRHMLPS